MGVEMGMGELRVLTKGPDSRIFSENLMSMGSTIIEVQKAYRGVHTRAPTQKSSHK